MAVRIGHASCDEYGRASGGAAGDQTGKEVCVRNWYSGVWNVVLRPLSPAVAEKMAAFCEAVCNNPQVGYDQGNRNSLRRAAMLANWNGAAISQACETDCSAFMTVCAEAAGISVPYSGYNAPTTWTMRKAFTGTGAFVALTDSKYLVCDNFLKRGDILVRESGHTAMVLSDGSDMASNTAPAGTTGTKSTAAVSTEQGTEAVYTVVPGDTLWDIARKYGTSVAEICALNGIVSTAFLRIGQKIKIPKGG